MLAGNGWGLVHGAGEVGLRGRVARAHRAAGGLALGVIPAHLFPREVARGALDRPVVTETMHERKKAMSMNADAVVCLPGGAGSLDESFEVLTGRRIGRHGKPILLLNVAGYWAPLLALLRHVLAEGFAGRPDILGFVAVAEDVEALEGALRTALA